MGLGVCGLGIQLRGVGEVGGVVHIGLCYPTIVVESMGARTKMGSDYQMTHSQKIDRLVSELKAEGVGRNWSSPPLFRMLWALGIKVPPPLFMHFFPLAILIGGFVFVMLIILRLWFLGLRADLLPGDLLLLPTAAGSVGLLASWNFHRKARRLQLPSWETYGISN